MPILIAMLLGYDKQNIISNKIPIVNHRHCVIFGARSFEHEEQILLNKLNIRYYTMAEIKRRGFYRCFDEAWRIVSACPSGFGISLDLDAIDTTFAPAVSVKVNHGLSWPLLYNALRQHRRPIKLKAIELTEFNCYLDKQKRTLRIVQQFICIYGKH